MFMVLKESRGIESNKQDSCVLASATELPEPVEIRWRLGLGFPREIPRPRPLAVQLGLCLPTTTFHSNEVFPGTFTDFLEYILSTFYFLALYHGVLPSSDNQNMSQREKKCPNHCSSFTKQLLLPPLVSGNLAKATQIG